MIQTFQDFYFGTEYYNIPYQSITEYGENEPRFQNGWDVSRAYIDDVVRSYPTVKIVNSIINNEEMKMFSINYLKSLRSQFEEVQFEESGTLDKTTLKFGNMTRLMPLSDAKNSGSGTAPKLSINVKRWSIWRKSFWRKIFSNKTK